MELDVRRLEPSDHALLRSLRLRALSDTPSAFGSTYEREAAFTEADWRGRLHAAANPHFVCAYGNGDPVGLVAVGREDTGPGLPARRVAFVWGMWVDPIARGSGAADALVHAALEWAGTNGFDVVRLRVTEGNARAERLYEKLGFRRTGTSSTHAKNGLPEIEMEHLAPG